MTTIVRTDAGFFPKVSARCREHLLQMKPPKVRLVEIVQAHDIKGHNRNIYVNMLCGLNQCNPGLVYFVEYDCLYPPGYFEQELDTEAVNVSPDMLILNDRGFFRRQMAAMSTMAGDRDFLRAVLWDRVSHWHQRRPYLVRPKYGTPVVDFHLPIPAVDVRHGRNFTRGREPPNGVYMAEHDYWGSAHKLFRKLTGCK